MLEKNMQQQLTNTSYIPGMCNIGKEERTRRERVGWFGFILTVLVYGVLSVWKVNPWWRLSVFFPATLSALGFLQAYFHFCVGFARRGVFNFDTLGKTTAITDTASRKKDTKREHTIIAYALGIGLGISILSVFL